MTNTTYILEPKLNETVLNVETLETPMYLLRKTKLIENLERLLFIQEKTGADIFLALKAFSMFSVFDWMTPYLKGCSASSLYEVRLGYDCFKHPVHVYSPAYKESDLREMLPFVRSVTFNSFSQWKKFRLMMAPYSNIDCGLRLNPNSSEVEQALYNPSSPHSRFGVTYDEFNEADLEGISGFLVHNLCGNHVDSLERTVDIIEQKFSKYFHQIDWLNFGGGHLFTHPDYDIDRLALLVKRLQDTYHVKVLFEPGEAVVYQAGVLVASVLDIVYNKMPIAILDTSATAHMPDVLEMPYRPDITHAQKPWVLPNTYRLGGCTCLSGDVIGDYSFEKPLQVGDKLIFEDMAQYTMVKNTFFNGVQLPSIAIEDEHGDIHLQRTFTYDDFKGRL